MAPSTLRLARLPGWMRRFSPTFPRRKAPSREHSAPSGDAKMNTALHRFLLLLLLALPWAVHAGDAADYAKASPAKQAKLLESWAAEPVAERLPLIEALRANRVAIDRNKTPFIEDNGAYRALEGEAEPVGTPKKLRLNNRLRGLL